MYLLDYLRIPQNSKPFYLLKVYWMWWKLSEGVSPSSFLSLDFSTITFLGYKHAFLILRWLDFEARYLKIDEIDCEDIISQRFELRTLKGSTGY
jgi:hypothetical protein